MLHFITIINNDLLSLVQRLVSNRPHTMIQELHPKLSIKVVFLKSWWLLIVTAIWISIIMGDISEQPTPLSWAQISLLLRHNAWFLLLGSTITFVMLILIYLDLTAYLQIEDGILERRWSWKRGGKSNQVKLSDMQKCTIERDVLSVGRGIKDFYGFVFEPKKPQPFWEEPRIEMPEGVASIDQEKFLTAIRAEMRHNK